MVTGTLNQREFASPEQIELLRKFKKQGTLSKKQLTKSLWLPSEIAKELGYNQGESDFLLSPGEVKAGNLRGRLPLPTYGAPPQVIQPEFAPEVGGNLRNLLLRLYSDKIPGALRVVGVEGLQDYILKDIQSQLTTNPEQFLQDLAGKRMPGETRALLNYLNVPLDVTDEIIGVQDAEIQVSQTLNRIPGFAGYNLDDFTNLIETNPQQVMSMITSGGITPAKRDLMRLLGLTESEISAIIRTPLPVGAALDEGKLAIEAEIREREKRIREGKQGKFGRLFTAGVGDLVANVGGVFKWAGAEGIGDKISQAGQFMQVQAQPMEKGEFKWQDLFDPTSYSFQSTLAGIIRATPTLMTLAIPGIGAYGLAGSVAARLGLGAFTRAIITGIGGSALSRPLESAMEAAGSYDEARARGLSHEEAVKVANSVFKKNLALVGTDIVQLTAAFAPTPFGRTGSIIQRGLVKTAQVGGKLTITGLTEGGEEIYQDLLQRQARGEKFKMDADAQQVFAIGAVMGLGMGGGGDILMRVTDKVATGFTPQQKAQFDGEVRKNKAKGLDEIQAQVQAMDKVVENNPDIAKKVEAATQEINKELTQEQLDKIRVQPAPTATTEAGVAPEKVTPAPEVTKGGFQLRERIVEGKRQVLDPETMEWIEAPKAEPVPEAVKTLPELRTLAGEKGYSITQIAKPVRGAETAKFRVTGITEATKGEKSYWDNLEQVQSFLQPEAPAVAEAITPIITETTPTGETIPSAYTEAPQPTEGATARVFSRIQTEPAETGFKEKVRQGWHKFNIKMVDDLDPIRRIVNQLKQGGIELSIDENPYLLARLLRGVTSKATTFLEYGTFGKNFYKVDRAGKASPNYTGESLQNILNEVKDPVKWRDFSTYLVDRRAVELSARNIETGIEVADAKASIVELEAKYPEFEGLAQRVYKYQDSLLVYAQEMGLLSKEMLEKLRKYGNYVPFYRVFNELQAKGLFGKKMVNVASPIKRIKGSEREIINPLESIVKNTYVLVNAADRNQVGIAIANLVDKNPELADVFERVKTPIARVAQVSAKELGVEVEGLTEAEEEQMVDIFRPSFFVRGDEVTVLIDGKKSYYRVDADLRDSLLRLDRESLGLLGKWLGAPARWLRAGATLSPDFMFRNPARDQLTAFAYSNYGFMPGVDWIKGLASIVRKDADYQLFRMSGAEHSMLVSMDRSYLQKTFRQIVEGKGFTEYVKHPMELFRIVSELGEKATRLGEFKKGIQSGAVPLEAGYSARSVTLDFAQAGTTAQAINTFIAFFNANLRGWGKMISSFKEQPIRTSAKVFIGITLPSILLWAVNHDDDRWKEIPQWQKDLFWIIFVGDNIFRIPKPFELGILFGSVPERFLDWLVDRDPDLLKDLAQSLMEAGSPGLIPTAGLPIIEWMTNYSFFRGRAIVPKSRQAMPPELQYTPWTSEVSKKLGELLKLPPAQLDNLMFAWTGGLGRYATDILDGILKKTGISPDIPEPSPTLADLPVIKAFVVRSPYGSSSEAVNDFYNFLEKYEAGEKYLKEMLINGELEKYNKYKAAHPELFFFANFDSERYKEAIEKGETPKDVYYSSSARYLRRIANELSELGKKEDLIYKYPDMSPEKKRELIDEIEILKTDIARKAVDLLQQKEPPILQERINEVIGKLGQVIEEATPLSLEKPDIFTVPDAYREFDSILEGATVEDLKGLEGIDPLALAYIKKEEIEKTLEPILNKQVKDIDFNLKEGVTFEDYYKQWQLGLVKDSPLNKISRRQVELLRKYEASDDKKAFLKSLTDEERALLTENPQKERLRSHPTENAEWALAGKTSILTQEAYNQFKTMVKELDIPDSAIPEMTLPPETSLDTHFTYLDMVSAGTHGSWEAQLLLKQDAIKAKEAGVQSYTEWAELKLSDTPMVALELKTEKVYRETYLKLEDKDYLDTLDDKIKDEDGLTARDRAIAELKATKIGDMTWIDIDRKITAIEQGTDETPIPDEIVNAYVSHYQIVDQTSGNSAEAKLDRYDNTELNDFMMNEDYWGTQKAEPLDEDKFYLDNYLVPRWRIEVDEAYKAKDAEYNAIRNPIEAQQARLRAEWLAKPENAEYRKNKKRIEAYELNNSLTGERLPINQIENYVTYNELSIKGKRRDRFLVENPEFARALYDAGAIADLPDPAKVPAVQYDDIYDKYADQFDEIEGNGQPESDWFEPDPIKRAARDKALRFNEDGIYTDFGLAELHREAYGKMIPDDQIGNYVGYYTILGQGKPPNWVTHTGQDLPWYEDDWFLVEHQDFYQQVYLGILGNERKDFRKLPTREVFAKYLDYENMPPGKLRQDYRFNNPDLEEWLLLTGKVTTPITEQKRRAELTPRERLLEKIYAFDIEFDKRMAELRAGR